MQVKYPEILELLYSKEKKLKKTAAKSFLSKREVFEEETDFETPFQVDRERILHSKAFRRLKRKTQVFYTPQNDHLRTRLTHTLEVEQIALMLSRILNLNEDLTSAISLGHDLGHTPFGHTGEDALNSVSSNGFSHAKHSIRVVDKIEKLNLTIETRDGILNHTGSLDKIEAKTLEGQIVKFADKIAYLCHDIDDAVRNNIIKISDIPFNLRTFFDLENNGIIKRAVEEIYNYSNDKDVIFMSDEAFLNITELRNWMFNNVYFNDKIKQDELGIKKIVIDLFNYYKGLYNEEEAVDYVAGMSDEFAINQHAMLVK